jgi:hypothetical protein
VTEPEGEGDSNGEDERECGCESERIGGMGDMARTRAARAARQ